MRFSSVAQLCLTLCNPMDCSTPGFPVHLILCCPLLLLPSIFPSIMIFSNESVLCVRQPKFWSFNFSISPSNEYSGLISFRMEWLDLLAVQVTVKSLQHHSSKASILWRSVFFIVQLSHPYTATGRNIALTRWTSVGKVLVSTWWDDSTESFFVSRPLGSLIQIFIWELPSKWCTPPSSNSGISSRSFPRFRAMWSVTPWTIRFGFYLFILQFILLHPHSLSSTLV